MSWQIRIYGTNSYQATQPGSYTDVSVPTPNDFIDIEILGAYPQLSVEKKKLQFDDRSVDSVGTWSYPVFNITVFPFKFPDDETQRQQLYELLRKYKYFYIDFKNYPGAYVPGTGYYVVAVLIEVSEESRGAYKTVKLTMQATAR